MGKLNETFVKEEKQPCKKCNSSRIRKAHSSLSFRNNGSPSVNWIETIAHKSKLYMADIFEKF